MQLEKWSSGGLSKNYMFFYTNRSNNVYLNISLLKVATSWLWKIVFYFLQLTLIVNVYVRWRFVIVFTLVNNRKLFTTFALVSWSCTHVFIVWTGRHTCAPHFEGIISVWPGTHNMRYFTEMAFRERSQQNAFPTTTGTRQMAWDVWRNCMCRILAFKYVFRNGEFFLLQMR